MNKIAFALMLISSLCLWSCSGDDDDDNTNPNQYPDRINKVELAISAYQSDTYTISYTAEIKNADEINLDDYSFYCYISTFPITDFTDYSPANYEPIYDPNSWNIDGEYRWKYQELAFYKGKSKISGTYWMSWDNCEYYVYLYAHRRNDNGSMAYDSVVYIKIE